MILNYPVILYGLESFNRLIDEESTLKAIIVFNGKEKICIPIPELEIEAVDVKIIRDIMNFDKGTVKDRLSIVNSFLRYLRRKQSK